MQAIKSLDTKNYTYKLGYSITAKTSYEERQEQRERLIILTVQRIAAIALIIICSLVSAYTKEGMALVVGLFVGSILLFYKNLFYQED